MINSTSPLLQQRIAQQNNNTPVQETKQNLQQVKQDSVELSVKPEMSKKKKALIAFGAAVGVAAVVTGVVALVKKGKTKNEGDIVGVVQGTAKKIQSEAQNIQKTAQNIQDSAKNIQDTAQNIQKSAQELQEKANTIQTSAQKTIEEALNSLKDVEPLEDGTKVAEKFAEDGKTLIKRASQNGELLTIDDFIEKTRIEAQNGKLCSFSTGVELSGNDIKKAQERFCFYDGELSRFNKGYEYLDDASWKAEEMSEFCDGKLTGFNKGYESVDGYLSKIEESFDFKDGKLKGFCKGFESPDGESYKIEERFAFEDDALKKVQKGIVPDEQFENAEEMFEFDNGKLSVLGKNVKILNDLASIPEEAFIFENGEVNMFMKNKESVTETFSFDDKKLSEWKRIESDTEGNVATKKMSFDSDGKLIPDAKKDE